MNTRTYRRILIAAGATVLISLTLLGLIGFARWRNQQALQSDTRTIIHQASNQLIRSLNSRRGTLTLLRDTFRKSPDLSPAQLKALGESAVAHTRHLLGCGLLRFGETVSWWSAPLALTASQRAEVAGAITAYTRSFRNWRVPMTLATRTQEGRQVLIMLEPLRNPKAAAAAVVGIFDLTPLLEDFFTSGVVQGFPAQLLDKQGVLFRSSHWMPETEANKPVIVEASVSLDAAQWKLQMQPGKNKVTQTLSWATVLLVILSIAVGLGFSLIIWILAARTWLLQRAVARRTAALRRSLQRVRQLATLDELTGLYNRRFFLRRWIWECDRAKRYQRPLTCLMVDVNGFKQVNDRLGHLTGDFILKQVAEELKKALRQSDIIARFGGDEFIVALPETPPNQAALVAEKLRQARIPLPEGPHKDVPPVSLSVGVSRSIAPNDQPEDLLEAADKSLYASKHHLSNRVTQHLKATIISS